MLFRQVLYFVLHRAVVNHCLQTELELLLRDIVKLFLAQGTHSSVFGEHFQDFLRLFAWLDEILSQVYWQIYVVHVRTLVVCFENVWKVYVRLWKALSVVVELLGWTHKVVHDSVLLTGNLQNLVQRSGGARDCVQYSLRAVHIHADGQ